MTDTPYLWPPTVELRRSPESIAAHLDALKVVVADRGPRRGVIYVGGGRYWPGVAVGVRMLRDTGCTLPVEVWYRGSVETVTESDVSGLSVTFHDVDSYDRLLNDNRVDTPDEYAGGWESKLYALTHTQLDQVLYLDADAYCVADPWPLFDMLDEGAPFIYWRDMDWCENSTKWARVWPAGRRGVPVVQGGQLVIDRRHAAHLIRVAHWICQHSDFYFGSLYGDQDAWRVALAATGTPYLCLGSADWERPAFVCRYHGLPAIVHRCQSKMYADEPPEWSAALPLEDVARAHFERVVGLCSVDRDSAPPQTATVPMMSASMMHNTAAMQPSEPPNIVAKADLP